MAITQLIFCSSLFPFSYLLSLPCLITYFLSEEKFSLVSTGMLGVLALGFLYGLKHATEADHIVAVSTIVSEQRNLAKAMIVGGLWGTGHTLSIVLVGIIVISSKTGVPENIAEWLESAVAIMIIWLGIVSLIRASQPFWGKVEYPHKHPHNHQHSSLLPHPHSHSFSFANLRRGGLKPLLVGTMHGLAGSAALTLLVLTQIQSTVLGMFYLLIFGLGSIFGMMLMSSLLGLPFIFSSDRLNKFNHILQLTAGFFSVAFGIWYALQTGLIDRISTHF